jgi:hypothetical protein
VLAGVVLAGRVLAAGVVLVGIFVAWWRAIKWHGFELIN